MTRKIPIIHIVAGGHSSMDKIKKYGTNLHNLKCPIKFIYDSDMGESVVVYPKKNKVIVKYPGESAKIYTITEYLNEYDDIVKIYR